MQPTPAPFFSNDQWGLLKVLFIVVAPIIVGVWGFLWKTAHSKDRHDLDEIGRKINELREKDLGELRGADQALGARMDAFEKAMAGLQSDMLTAIHESGKQTLGAINDLSTQLARLDERLKIQEVVEKAVDVRLKGRVSNG